MRSSFMGLITRWAKSDAVLVFEFPLVLDALFSFVVHSLIIFY